jgi:hypothetical protein
MKYLLSIALAVISSVLSAQTFIVTPDGLRDSSDNKKYYIVLQMPGRSASQLYSTCLKELIRNRSGKERTVTASTENEFIKYETLDKTFMIVNNGGAKILFSARYTIELSFKDGRIRVEPTLLNMFSGELGIPIVFTGGLLDGYAIYDKKGNLKRPVIKSDLERYFSDLVKSLRYEISPDQKTDWQP